MKKSLMIIVAVLAGGLLVCSCGYGGGGLDGGTDGGQDGNGGGNECQQAAEIRALAVDPVCASYKDTCCFCKCWFDDRKTFDVNEYFQNENCICEVRQPNPQPCVDAALADAQQCLADQIACQQQAVEMVTDAQEGMCTMTPL
jgi:hypothetical protein